MSKIIISMEQMILMKFGLLLEINQSIIDSAVKNLIHGSDGGRLTFEVDEESNNDNEDNILPFLMIYQMLKFGIQSNDDIEKIQKLYVKSLDSKKIQNEIKKKSNDVIKQGFELQKTKDELMHIDQVKHHMSYLIQQISFLRQSLIKSINPSFSDEQKQVIEDKYKNFIDTVNHYVENKVKVEKNKDTFNRNRNQK